MDHKTHRWVSDVDSFLRVVQESNQRNLRNNNNSVFDNRDNLDNNSSNNQELAHSIPKTAHVIWLGTHELPPSANYCMQRFRSLHPHWGLSLWRDVEAQALLADVCSNTPALRPLPAIYNQLSNVGMKSDIIRYLVLLRHGGLYFDVDYEFVRCSDPVLVQTQAGFVCGFSNTSCNEEVNNGILAACPNHVFTSFILQQIVFSLRAVMPNPALTAFMSDEEVRNFMQALHGKTTAITPPSQLLNSLIICCLVITTVESPMGVITHTGPGMLTKALDTFLKTQLQEEEEEK